MADPLLYYQEQIDFDFSSLFGFYPLNLLMCAHGLSHASLNTDMWWQHIWAASQTVKHQQSSVMTQCNAHWSGMCNAYSDCSAGAACSIMSWRPGRAAVIGVDYLRSTWSAARSVCVSLLDCDVTDQMHHGHVRACVRMWVYNIDCSVESHCRQRTLPQCAVNSYSNWAAVIIRACVLPQTSFTSTSITVTQETGGLLGRFRFGGDHAVKLVLIFRRPAF